MEGAKHHYHTLNNKMTMRSLWDSNPSYYDASDGYFEIVP